MSTSRRNTMFCCLSMVSAIFGGGLLYSTLALRKSLQEHDQLTDPKCLNLVPWCFTLSAIAIASAVFSVFLAHKASCLRSMCLSHIFQCQEALSLIVVAAAAIVSVGIAANWRENCNLVSTLSETFIYVYWSTCGLIYLTIFSILKLACERSPQPAPQNTADEPLAGAQYLLY